MGMSYVLPLSRKACYPYWDISFLLMKQVGKKSWTDLSPVSQTFLWVVVLFLLQKTPDRQRQRPKEKAKEKP